MTPLTKDDLTLVANTIRCLAMDGVQAANSGHPGMPMGMADVASVLWLKYLKHCPANPKWADRDRFVLSAGHGSMLLYSLLHLAGYKLPMDELKRFRQLGSRTPGHPEHGETEGVETTTGPLGQGIGNAWAWRSPNACWRRGSTARPSFRSITARGRSAATATSWKASATRPAPWPATSNWTA